MHGWVLSTGATDALVLKHHALNSLAPGKFERNFRYVIFKQILLIAGWGISCEIAQIWMSVDFTDGQSTLVQVMAWCLQATSHYLSQCWLRSKLPYGVTRPHWVNKYTQCWPKSHCIGSVSEKYMTFLVFVDQTWNSLKNMPHALLFRLAIGSFLWKY